MGDVKFNHGRYSLMTRDIDRWAQLLEDAGIKVVREKLHNNQHFSEEGEVTSNGVKLIYSIRHPKNGCFELGIHPSNWIPGEEGLAERIRLAINGLIIDKRSKDSSP